MAPLNRGVRVKVCGITRLEDAQAAVSEGVHALGFVFHPASPRFVAPEKAAAIISNLVPFTMAVGVFVNLPAVEVAAIADRCRLHAVQLHGDESPEECAAATRPVIKGFRFDPAKGKLGLSRYAVSSVLVDASVAGAWGGTGVPVDWELLNQFLETEPEAVLRRLVLAGGLTPYNVREAINRVKPFAVDVSTGVEVEPGIKDHKKIKEFMNAIRSEGNPGQMA
jgi:phosphoribosylanthranilate isomerase